MTPGVTFENGSHRNDSKPRYDLILADFQRLTAEAMTEGTIHHGELNYQRGGVEFIKETYNHLFEHVLKIKSDPADVATHIGHASANLNLLTYFLMRDGTLGGLHARQEPDAR